MAATLQYSSPTSGTAASSTTILDRQTPLSSFPSSRTTVTTPPQNDMTRGTTLLSAQRSSGSSSGSSLTPASSDMAASRSQLTTRPRRLRSQYPRDSTERHVEYILVASFHVDRGPIMEHQYPGPISGDEHMLAELMLPDQAHVRNQDWTIFFLHKDTSQEEEAEREAEEEKKKLQRGDMGRQEREASNNPDEDKYGVEGREDMEGGDDQDEGEGGEGPPLIYVLNLVNTKQDTSAKRCFKPVVYSSPHIWY